MDKIYDHPRFRPANLKLEPGGAAGFTTTSVTAEDMAPASRAGAAMTGMLTGCIVNHAMQHGIREAIDVAISVFMSTAIALEVSEESLTDILAMMPEARQTILAQVAAREDGPAPDSAS